MPAALPWTELDDAAIKRIYETTDVVEQRRRKARYVAMTRWTGKQVYHRALQLGAIKSKVKEPNWSDAEIDFILSQSGFCVQHIRKKMIKAGFPVRTLSAIGDRLRKEAGSVKVARQDAGVYSGNEVADLLGVDSKTVSSWCRQGLLRGVYSENSYGPHHAWRIKEKDIRRFVIDHVGRVNFARCDKFWLVDLLCPQHGAKNRVEAA